VLAVSFFLAQLVPLDGAGLYGVALAAVGMASTIGAYMTLSALGPILEVADEIAEMTGLPPEVKVRTDQLAYAGRGFAAQARGFATGVAAFSSLAAMLAFAETYRLLSGRVAVLTVFGSPSLMIGVLLGAALPFLLSALMTDAVGRTVAVVVAEVERQFREIPGLAEGDAQPDAATCVAVVTEKVKREVIAPCVLAGAVPLVVGLISPAALGGLLLGALGSGFVLSIALGNAGGAWRGARKYIEDGHHGGRGSQSHLAAAAGDMVGQYLRDASSPSLNSLLTLMSAIALAFAPLIAAVQGP
jgi:K(+)-stimulated pyrophosphate-energized sodium pump